MIFAKFNMFIIVGNLFVRAMLTLDTTQVYHYYETISYTKEIKWSSNVKVASRGAAQTTLPQPVPYYIAPVTKASLQQPIKTTTRTTKKTYDDQAVLVSSPNKLNHNLDDGMTNDEIPLNPVPMLKPNPFTYKNGGGNFLPTKGFNSFNGSQRKEEGAFCRRSFDGRSGYCVLAYQCLHVIHEYREHGTKIDTCTYRKNIPVICCPLSDKQIDEQRISAQKCQEYHEAVKDITLNLPRKFSDKMCVSSIPLIVGGKVTKNEEYPHMAAVGWTQSNGDVKWGCGGTLISDQFILTAAHCATAGGTAPDLIRLGTKDLYVTDANQQDIKILMIFLHPKYFSTSYYHDIALLKLTKRVRLSTYVQPACLWQLPDVSMPTVIATGWGRTEFLGNKTDKLQKVDLNIIDQQKCKRTYYKERRLPHGITEKQFCAGHMEGGKDTCQGDSGGPLHAELPEFNCVKFVIGITSFGKFCAVPNMPGVYTKIYSYLDWIEKIVFKI